VAKRDAGPGPAESPGDQRLSRLACRRLPVARVDAVAFSRLGDRSRSSPRRFTARLARPAAEPRPGFERARAAVGFRSVRAASRRTSRSSPAAARATVASRRLTRASTSSKTSALAAAVRFVALARPRDASLPTRRAAPRRYCVTYFVRARRTRTWSSRSSSSSSLAKRSGSASRTRPCSVSFNMANSDCFMTPTLGPDRLVVPRSRRPGSGHDTKRESRTSSVSADVPARRAARRICCRGASFRRAHHGTGSGCGRGSRPCSRVSRS
jgi:hypothetical protein